MFPPRTHKTPVRAALGVGGIRGVKITPFLGVDRPAQAEHCEGSPREKNARCLVPLTGGQGQRAAGKDCLHCNLHSTLTHMAPSGQLPSMTAGPRQVPRHLPPRHPMAFLYGTCAFQGQNRLGAWSLIWRLRPRSPRVGRVCTRGWTEVGPRPHPKCHPFCPWGSAPAFQLTEAQEDGGIGVQHQPHRSHCPCPVGGGTGPCRSGSVQGPHRGLISVVSQEASLGAPGPNSNFLSLCPERL